MLCLALLGVLVLAGCMGGGSSKTADTSTSSSSSSDGVSVSVSVSSSNSSSPSSSSSSTSVSPRPAKTWDVTIDMHAFSPAQLTIQKGDTVRWTMKEIGTTHTATSDAGAAEAFDSGSMTVVSSPYSHTFSVVGTDAYHCSVHSDMHGTITVVEAMST